MTEEAFLQSIDRDDTIARAVFQYLSLSNASIEKEFMESRLVDLIHHPVHRESFTVAPWESLLDVLGFSPALILSVAAGVAALAPTEAQTLVDLEKQIPTLQLAFNRSVVDIALSRQHITSATSSILSKTHWELIRMIAPSDNAPDLLYSSAQHGSSFRVMAPAIKCYPGALLLVLACEDGRIFGFHSKRSEWKESAKFDELARDSFLFQLGPELRIRRVNRNGASNCVYFNASNPNHPIGIGLGGREGSFRFWLDGTDLSRFESMSVDATFEPGQLLSGPEEVAVSVHAIEVFGFSGADGRELQQAKKLAEAEVRSDRKKVDRSKLVQNEFDKEVLFSKTFQSNQDRLGTA